MIGATILLCLVVEVKDVDTIVCKTGEHVRIAAVSGLEKNGSCNSRPYCPTMRHRQAKPIAERLTLGKTIAFKVMAYNHGRPVGENYTLRCQLVHSTAVVEWPRYLREYGLRSCSP